MSRKIVPVTFCHSALCVYAPGFLRGGVALGFVPANPGPLCSRARVKSGSVRSTKHAKKAEEKLARIAIILHEFIVLMQRTSLLSAPGDQGSLDFPLTISLSLTKAYAKLAGTIQELMHSITY